MAVTVRTSHPSVLIASVPHYRSRQSFPLSWAVARGRASLEEAAQIFSSNPPFSSLVVPEGDQREVDVGVESAYARKTHGRGLAKGRRLNMLNVGLR